MNKLAIAAALIGLAAVAYFTFGPDTNAPTEVADAGGGPIVQVVLPAALTAEQELGKTIFEAKCAVCHAVNAVGQEGVAPPLVHKIYEPSHHGDEAFQRAVALGVRGHHWTFGDMPPVDGLTRGDVKLVVAYIRALQRENGIN